MNNFILCVLCGHSVVGVPAASASVSRQGAAEYFEDDSATTVTSPAGSSCGSLTESDVFKPSSRHSRDILDSAEENNTLKYSSDYADQPAPRARPSTEEDSWKALTQHVIGGGYQIRPPPPPPQRLREYSPSDVDDYR